MDRHKVYVAAADIWAIVQSAGNRSMASDGPCGPEHEFVTKREWKLLKRAAQRILKEMNDDSM